MNPFIKIGKSNSLPIKERIKALNQKGLTREEIAKAVGCGVVTVRVLRG